MKHLKKLNNAKVDKLINLLIVHYLYWYKLILSFIRLNSNQKEYLLKTMENIKKYNL